MDGPIAPRRGPSPTLWFGLGVYASWAAAMTMGVSAERPPTRGNTEGGVFIGFFFSIPMAASFTLPFWAWCRRRVGRRSLSGHRFLVPFGLGLLHPWLAFGIMSLLVWPLPLRARPYVGALASIGLVFGPPVTAGVLTIRAMKADVDPRGPRSGQLDPLPPTSLEAEVGLA